MPREVSALDREAWEAWRLLDVLGRDLDSMAGNPLPIRLEAMDRESLRSSDPDAVRWRILLIEKHVLTYRREHMKKRG